MNILFENKTKYSSEIYTNFLEFHRKKFHLSYLIYNIIVIGLILTFSVLQVQYHNYPSVIILGYVLIGFIVWRYLHPANEIVKEFQSDKFQKEQVFTFKFYSNFLTCESEKEKSEIKYYRLYRVFETNDFFYLYIDKNHAFLINKSSFDGNNSADFSNFIHKKCFLCYRNCVKKRHV